MEVLATTQVSGAETRHEETRAGDKTEKGSEASTDFTLGQSMSRAFGLLKFRPRSNQPPETEATKPQETRETPTPPDRALATLRTIKKIDQYHSTRDAEFAHVDGWRCEVPRAKFKAGDLVLYIEIDAFIPSNQPTIPEFDNLEPKVDFQGQRGILVETRCTGKTGKEVSQGLIFAVSDIFQLDLAVSVIRELRKDKYEDEIRMELREWDASKLLGIRKYSIPAPAANLSDGRLGKLPKFLHKVKVDRVQNCVNFFNKPKYIKMRYQESVKLDGATMTCYFIRKDSKYYRTLPPLPEEDEYFARISGGRVARGAYDTPTGRFGVCSSTADLDAQVGHLAGVDYWGAAAQDGLPAKMVKLNANLAIRGELLSWNVNGNRHNYPAGKMQFHVFGVYDIDLQAYWKPAQTVKFASKHGLRHVPVRRESVSIMEICPKRKKGNVEFLELADKMHGEGLVYKCIEDGRWFKVVSNKYLLKYGLMPEVVA
jgi:RNA ligase (TIGR02306 family)